MPDDKRRVVSIGPGTELGQRRFGRLEGPFDRPAHNPIGIHTGSLSAVSQQRLQRRIVNELTPPIALDQQVRTPIALAYYHRVGRDHAPNQMPRLSTVTRGNP